jgi:hypothetical protein
MSGIGGHVQNFNNFRNNATVDRIRIDEQSSNSVKVTILTGMGHVIYIPKDVYQFNKSYFIKISSEGYNEGDLFLSFYAPSTSTATTVKVPLNPNGITEIPAIKEDDFLAVYLFNAACSDGRAYDRNWNEILANTGNVVGSGGILEVSSSGGRFGRIAFKNLAIYPRILSKDDCIKAYSYLQTLKAK